jgi:hypothetical protein
MHEIISKIEMDEVRHDKVQSQGQSIASFATSPSQNKTFWYIGCLGNVH